MINLRNIFTTKFFYNVALKLNSMSGVYLSKKRSKKKQSADEKWNRLFDNATYIQHDISHKIKINLYADSALSRMIVEGYERDELRFVKRILKPGNTFVDVGANVGIFTLTAAELVGEYGSVICFEPTEKTYNRLLENISLNNFSNVRAEQKALSDKVERMLFHQSKNGFDAWNSFSANPSDLLQSADKINTSTLDIELSDSEKAAIALIKIDVEGWEKFVLKGGVNLLTNFAPIVIMEFTEANTFSAGYHVQELYDFLQNLGYHWFSFKSDVLTAEPKKLHYPYENLIATKDEKQLRDLLRSSSNSSA